MDPFPAVEGLGHSIPALPLATRLRLTLALSSLELVVAVGMLLPATRMRGLLSAMIVSSGAFVFAVVDGLRGLTGDCGCFGVLTGLNSYAIRLSVAAVLVVASTIAVRLVHHGQSLPNGAFAPVARPPDEENR